MSSDAALRPRFVAHSPSRGFYLGSGYWSSDEVPEGIFPDMHSIPTFTTRDMIRRFVGRSMAVIPADWEPFVVRPDMPHKRASLDYCRKELLLMKEGAD